MSNKINAMLPLHPIFILKLLINTFKTHFNNPVLYDTLTLSAESNILQKRFIISVVKMTFVRTREVISS